LYENEDEGRRRKLSSFEVVVELGDADRDGYAWNGCKREEGRWMMEDVRGKMEEVRWKMSHRTHRSHRILRDEG